MQLMHMRATVLAAGAAMGLAAIANADVLVTVRYDSLAGSYNSAMQLFTARAVDTAALRTTGAVSRLVPVAGTATFEPGFVSNPANPADFLLNVTAIPTGNPAIRTGSGSFVSTDRDGDTISGNINGTWRNGGPGFIFFNGTLNNVVITPAGQTPESMTFDGTLAGSWDLNLPAQPPYEGAIVQLVFGAPNFFFQDFNDRATGMTAQIVPTPGALALLGIGGLIAARRRR